MATKKTTEEVIPEGYESLYIPRAPRDSDQNVFIGLNGKNYLLPTGKSSVVPTAVADIYRRSIAAREALEATKDEMAESSQR